MKFSLNFIKEFFEPQISPEEISRRLTMAGLEVGSIEEKDGDYIFDAEVTPNRYDWLSAFGIANELACLCKQRLRVKIPSVKTKPLLNKPSIIIKDRNDCSVYIARLIKGVKIDDSPAWLKERVENCGIKSINNAVDTGNYCMLKWGNPLHTFDFDKIEGNIHIRRAKDRELFIGLDDKERLLGKDNLVISDDKKVIALAGVIGAKNAEVDSSTKNILIEGAVFSPLTIRRSRRSAGLDTDSSYRFERNVSSKLLDTASFDAARLLCELCGGEMAGYRKTGRSPSSSSKPISFSKDELNDYIGAEFSSRDIKGNLVNLGFEVKQGPGSRIYAKAPFFRKDIARREDIFEEIARCYGYENIKSELPPLKPQREKASLYDFKNQIRNFLLRLKLNEVITYSLSSSDNLRSLGEDSFITLGNSLRSERNALRTTLVLGMMEVIKHNFSQNSDALRFFEIADIYKDKGQGFEERLMLACAVTDEGGGFYYLKGITEETLKFLNIEKVDFIKADKKNFLNALNIVYKGKTLGFIGCPDNNIKRLFGVKAGVSFFELDIEQASAFKRKREYQSFSRFPLVYRDISLSLKKDVEFQLVREIIEKAAKEILYDYKVIDVYRGKDTQKGINAFTLRVFYNSPRKTLTAEEVDSVHFELRDRLSKEEGIILR